MIKEETKEVLPHISVAKVEFEIGKFAIDFLKDYLRFLGSNRTVEDVARAVLFEELCVIRDKLKDLPHQEDNDFFRKHLDVAVLESVAERKQLAEQEE